MSKELLEKLQLLQKKSKQSRKKNLNEQSAFTTLTDEEIALVLALRAKKLRVSQNKKQKEFSELSNLSSASTYANFEQKGSISLLNFIKIVRAFGRVEELEALLQLTTHEKIKQIKKQTKQRVR